MTYIGKPQTGLTRLWLKFQKPLTKPVTLIVYATFVESVNIDDTRTVSLQEKDKAIARQRRLETDFVG